MNERLSWYAPHGDHILARWWWTWQAWRHHGFALGTAWRLASLRWRVATNRLAGQPPVEAEQTLRAEPL